ncbi:MAG: hypothetical protein IPK83_09435 [Planctomycetes bacterium]|nr:hypothetical protein [Planctomycetota bacterium]
MPNPNELLSKLPKIPRGAKWAAIGLFAAGFVFVALFIIWFIIRVEVGTNTLLVFVNKTGSVLPKELHDEYGDQVVLYPELVKAIAAKTGESEDDVATATRAFNTKSERKAAISRTPGPTKPKSSKPQSSSRARSAFLFANSADRCPIRRPSPPNPTSAVPSPKSLVPVAMM